MEVEEETDCKKSWMSRGKKLAEAAAGDIEKFTDMEPMVRDSQKEKWKNQLQ